jgi:hypothetical protein
MAWTSRSAKRVAAPRLDSVSPPSSAARKISTPSSRFLAEEVASRLKPRGTCLHREETCTAGKQCAALIQNSFLRLFVSSGKYKIWASGPLVHVLHPGSAFAQSFEDARSISAHGYEHGEKARKESRGDRRGSLVPDAANTSSHLKLFPNQSAVDPARTRLERRSALP